MKKRIFVILLCGSICLPLSAQNLNLSLRTNNQQLIENALSGAFLKISQSYELCDTIKNEHFGREGRNYFSVISFIGVETERGLIYPSVAEKPWMTDEDFKEYEGKYKPIVSTTSISSLCNKSQEKRSVNMPFSGDMIVNDLSIINDSSYTNVGLKVDTIPGNKDGWFIWITQLDNKSKNDSVRLTSVRQSIETPEGQSCIYIRKPEQLENICGGIYVTPVQTAIGQITLFMTGMMINTEEGWKLSFPFMCDVDKTKPLTPISNLDGKNGFNTLKMNRKRK